MGFPAHLAAADRAVQGNLGGVPIIYQPADGPPVTVTGMFDEIAFQADQGNSGIEQTTPSVWLLLADLPGNPADDEATVTIAGVEYVTRERRVDPNGASIRIFLHRAE